MGNRNGTRGRKGEREISKVSMSRWCKRHEDEEEKHVLGEGC